MSGKKETNHVIVSQGVASEPSVDSARPTIDSTDLGAPKYLTPEKQMNGGKDTQASQQEFATHSERGSSPGVETFKSFEILDKIAPFGALISVYSKKMYPLKSHKGTRFQQYTEKYKVIHFFARWLDFLLRIVLVLLVLLIIFRGISAESYIIDVVDKVQRALSS